MFRYILIFCLILSSPVLAAEEFDQEKVYPFETPSYFTPKQKQDYFSLKASLSDNNNTDDKTKKDRSQYFYTIQAISQEGSVALNNDMVCQIGRWYRQPLKNWKPGQRIRISFFPNYSNYFRIQNVDTNDESWGVLKTGPSQNHCDKIVKIEKTDDPTNNSKGKLFLKSGYTFSGDINFCTAGDYVLVLHLDDKETYTLWNLSKSTQLGTFTIIPYKEPEADFNKAAILKLEANLNKQVFGQPNAAKMLAIALRNHVAGLKDQKTPIGVFLFIGPTGVGKTEIAKALASELYNDPAHLIRFDMSHFSDQWSLTRLIGSAPGYINSDEGGQLSNALLATPSSIVLLDEFEKAHSVIRKFFLPVLDEGFFRDAFNRSVPCHKAIFIMTSNACSETVCQLYNEGYSEEDILDVIEPELMSIFSPELYNRVTPILFRPLSHDLMVSLVKKMLQGVSDRAKKERSLILTFDDTIIEYLAVKGYHKTLGARPLKRLIDYQLIAFISQKIIEEEIPDGSSIWITYDKVADAFLADWTPGQE